MKTEIFKDGWPASGFWPRSRRLCSVLLALPLLLAGNLKAMPSVETLTGGPNHFYPQTAYGYVDGDTAVEAKFRTPFGLALDRTGSYLFVADRDNNAIRYLDLAGGQTWTLWFADTNLIKKPIAVALDNTDYLYVLNRGTTNSLSTSGTVLKFDGWGELVATKASGLTNAAGMALDSVGNLYVTVQSSNVVRITPGGIITTVATIMTNALTSLQGLVVKRNGLIAACDAGNQGIWLIDPAATNSYFQFAGFHGTGDFILNGNNVASPSSAKFNKPYGIAEAGDGTLLVADTGNHRVKVVLTSGVVTNLYGCTSNVWYGPSNPNQGVFPGWWDGTVTVPDLLGGVEARQPVGVAFHSDGTVYTTETYYHLIRKITSTGLPPPPPSPPLAPILTVVTTNFGLVGLAWSTSDSATNYFVKRAPSSGGPYTTIASTTGTTYTDTAVVNGTTYYYVVSASNGGGESPNSNEVIATPPVPPVADPQIGYVEFPPPFGESVFHPVSSVVFNNDKLIVIIGEAGTQTFYTNANTLVLSDVPNPTASSFSAPVGYVDGMSKSEVISLAVADESPQLSIKAIGQQPGRPNSAIVAAQFQFIVGNPLIIGDNAAQFTVSDITDNAGLWYTIDGSDPTNAAPSLFAGTISGTNAITLSLAFPPNITNMTFKVRGFKGNYQPSGSVSRLFSATNFNANKISFGLPTGEPSSTFVARPGQFYYAPVTLSVLPGAVIYSLQFNTTVTNGLVNTNTGLRPPAIANGAGIDFFSMLMSKVPLEEADHRPPNANNEPYLTIPPFLMTGISNQVGYAQFVNTNNNLLGVGWTYRTGYRYTVDSTNGVRLLNFDTTQHDLIKYSIAHDNLFDKDNGVVVVGGYSFEVPTTATNGDKYFIQLGSPSATRDGAGSTGADVLIQAPSASQKVEVGTPIYLVGDAAPFHWLNAGDFGNSNLNNSDVMQVFQSAVLGLNMPPLNSDLYRAMDSCGNIGVTNAGTGYFTDGGGYLSAYPVTNSTFAIVNHCTYDVDTNTFTTNVISCTTVSNFVNVVTVTPTTNITLYSTNTYVITNGTPVANQVVSVATNIIFTNPNLFRLFDGNDLTINEVAFGDLNLDVCDVFVTFRRSLDPSLRWFQRFWTNNQFVAVETPNLAYNSNTPSMLSPAEAASNDSEPMGSEAATVSQPLSVSFAAGDAVTSAGKTIQIPITANILGNYPVRVLGLNITVRPLDGSPALTVPVQFAPAPALGQPTIPASKNAANYSAAWLNTGINGLSGNANLGTLSVTLPANSPANAAYAVYFDHVSASPNGIATFPNTVRWGLVTLSDRSASSWGDGISDWWRLRNFATINNLLSAASADADGDGANNWHEYKAGTNPNDAASVLRLRSNRGLAQDFVIHWPSVANKQYVVERSTSLAVPTWTAISTNTGTGADIEFHDSSNGPAARFYRVRPLD